MLGYDGAANEYSRYLNTDGVDMSQVRICFLVVLHFVNSVVLFMLIFDMLISRVYMEKTGQLCILVMDMVMHRMVHILLRVHPLQLRVMMVKSLEPNSTNTLAHTSNPCLKQLPLLKVISPEECPMETLVLLRSDQQEIRIKYLTQTVAWVHKTGFRIQGTGLMGLTPQFHG